MSRMMFFRTFCLGWACILATPACALHKPPNQAAALQTPNQTAVKEVILYRDRPIPNPFKNVLLVIHCRLPMHLVNQDPGICAKRKPLYQGYKKYFGDVLWMTRDNCHMGFLEPHTCMVKLIRKEAAKRDGIFYVHFDALIRPATLAPTFDPTSMAFFGREDTCRLRQNGGATNCTWLMWDRWKDPYLHAIMKLKKDGVVTGKNADQIADPRYAWIGMDDVFYIPSRAFGLYANITDVFEQEQVHHEVAGPTIRRILSRMTNIQDKNMSCTGNCCDALGADVALKPDFRCGHAFRLQEKPIRDAFKSVLSLRRDRLPEGTGYVDGLYSSLEVQAKILEDATV